MLIERLDEATQEGSFETITGKVKEALIETIVGGQLVLPEELLQPCEEESGYARRLVHLDPDGRYSVVAMIWAEGQGTPIHDHDSRWCVEGVYQGAIQVTSYEMSPSTDDGEIRVEVCSKINASLGEAGALIPPHDYHVIENQRSETAVTIHVYGGEMKGCTDFEPINGGPCYVKKYKGLRYTD